MYQRFLRDFSAVSDSFTLMFSQFFLALVQGNLGRISEALRTLRQATELARRNGDAFWSTRLPNCIGWLYREMQAFDRSLEYDREGAELARRDRVLEAEANSLINQGIDHIEAGDSESPAPIFAEVESIFTRDAWFRWRYNIRFQASQCEHWLRSGDLARASEFALRLHEMANQYHARKYIAVAHTLNARISMSNGGHETALSELNAALQVLRQYPAPLQEWKTYAVLGRLHALMGNPQDACNAFGESAAIVQVIAQNVEEEALRSTFRNSSAVREVLEGARGMAGGGAP
jgi:tetratricopeptide (TPR) repeat protein